MKLNKAYIKHEVILIPTFGFINHRHYYGYPVFNIAFRWLMFGLSFSFGLRSIEK